jgi:hypothetical protein
MTCRKILVLLLAAGVAAGAPAGSGRGAEPTGGAVNVSPPSSCGLVPVSTGPAADLVVLEAQVPASAASGAEVPVEVSLHVRRDGQRIITSTARSQVLVARDGQVVARSSGSSTSRPAVPLQLRAGSVWPGQVVPRTVRLVGCTGDAPRSVTSLPPGRYAVVAVLAYGEDALNVSASGAGGRFQVVSPPAPITVT